MFKRRKPEAPPEVAPEVAMANEFNALHPGQAGPTEGLLAADAAEHDSFQQHGWPADTGLGVPPYRPALSKEASAMGRTPFLAQSPGQNSTQAPMPNSGGQPVPGAAPGGPAPGMATARYGAQPGRSIEAAERRTLVVGRGISVQGTVADAERLVVEGTVEASMIHATELSITLGGVFKGEVEVEDAEIAGVIDGTLTARGNLVVRATGKVLGTARCRRLQVEDGGQITGRIEMLADGAAPRSDTPRPLEVPG